MKKKKSKAMPVNNYRERELTANTKWIVCMWDILGDPPEETAIVLKRSLKQVKDIISQCKQDGYYEKVRRNIQEFKKENSLRTASSFLQDIKMGI